MFSIVHVKVFVFQTACPFKLYLSSFVDLDAPERVTVGLRDQPQPVDQLTCGQGYSEWCFSGVIAPILISSLLLAPGVDFLAPQ